MRTVRLLLVLLIAVLLPATGLAGPAEDSKVLAAKGATLFKKAEYLDAAQAFEKAYALDARDFRVLRYAGRAWQEIGHLDRALTLLERYYGMEKEADLKATVLPNLEKLRKATPREKAEALDAACRKYPQARLEEEAAMMLRQLGDRPSLDKAVQLLEVARLGAADPADKLRLDKEIKAVRDLAGDLEAKQAEAQRQATVRKLAGPGVQAKASTPKGPSTLQWVCWGGGTALVASGVALWLTGAADTQTANDDYHANKIGYSAYQDQRSSADVLYFTGIGLAVAGAGTAVAGFFLGPKDGKVAVIPGPGGATLALRF